MTNTYNYNLPLCDLADVQTQDPRFYCALFESTGCYQGSHVGRYSFLFCDPQQVRTYSLADAYLEGFFASTQQMLNQCEGASSMLPFTGGYLVLLAYDLNQALVPQLAKTVATDVPLAYLVRVPAAIIIDHQENRTTFVDESADTARYRRICKDIAKTKAKMHKSVELAFQSEHKSSFINKVKATLEYICAGDIFQVNISHQWYTHLPECDAQRKCAQMYKQLKRHNPAPFSALLHLDGLDILSSSPERLFLLNDNNISTRPIAGTAKRLADDRADQKAIQALLHSTKERAEHTMLIDLERNDLNKICNPTSTNVTQPMHLEHHPFVHHLVSEITGTVSHASVLDIIRAIFPGGSITGCPKIRCMEIIQELELMPRGYYTGALGYISRHGTMDFSILIRTLVRSDDSLSLHAGSGIVFNSTPEQEWHEVCIKAHSVLNCCT